MDIIARIENDYTDSFGIPRQSGLCEAVLSRIVPEPGFSMREAFRGIEEYSHLWLIWGFSKNENAGWHPTVQPPRLGGNARVGVFATRSPFRPNGLGLSCVRLVEAAVDAPDGPYLIVAGADLMNGTPIYDIKPYLPYADAFPEARVNEALARNRLAVQFPGEAEALLPDEKRAVLTELLSLDPRPAYQDDPARIYGFRFGGFHIRFRVEDGILTVLEITEENNT